ASPAPSSGYRTPSGADAAAAEAAARAPTVDYAGYAAHYERENQALREQLWSMRQMLESREAQEAHNSKLLAAAFQEGDSLAARLVALMAKNPQFTGVLWHVPPPVLPQMAPQLIPPPSPPPEEESFQTSAPATPSRRVLSLAHVTPAPSAGTYEVAQAAAQGQPAASPTPSPSPSGKVLPTPRRALLPSFAPPSHPAPGSLSPEPSKKPPDCDAMAETPPPKGAAPGLPR
ncbi:unnamed protein product, partial [Polarella glacialis]